MSDEKPDRPMGAVHPFILPSAFIALGEVLRGRLLWTGVGIVVAGVTWVLMCTCVIGHMWRVK